METFRNKIIKEEIMLLIMLFLILFLGISAVIFGYYQIFQSQFSPQSSTINETTHNQTTYQETSDRCSYNLTLYITQVPDYSSCKTQPECELKQLRLSILQQATFNCMNDAWEERG